MVAAPTGVGAITIAELQAQIAALQAQLTALQGTTTTGTGNCAGITFSRTLKLGMSGTDVKCLQSILNQAADTQVAATGVGSSGNETTYFGTKTKTAVIVFQQKYASEVLAPVGLTVGTGLVGAKTIAKLNTMTGTASTGTGTGTGTTEVLPTAAGLTVEVASGNPVAGTVISDGASAAAGSQALIPFLKLKFSTPAGTTAKVTTLKLKRIGVSGDSDLPTAYLYDGNTKLAEMLSLSSGVLTFTDSAGLFTVSGTKEIMVKGDLYQDATAGKTLGLSLNAAADVVTDATAVNGTFPMNGNLMTVAVVTDFARATVATTTNSATIDPGTTGFEAFRFTITATNQKLKLYSIKFVQLGSINKADISNLALYVGATQIGTTQTALATDGSVTFDFSSTPYEIGSGVAKTFSLKCDVIGGSTRSIRFALQKATDMVVLDANYGVYVKADVANIATFTVLYSSPTTVNSGNLVISKRTDSPSGNVSLNSTNVVLASYDVKAVGEDVKIENIKAVNASSSAWAYSNNVKVIIDGNQFGTTQSKQYSTTTYTSSYTFPVGVTKVVEIRGDISGDAGFASGDTMKAYLDIGASNAERKVSLGTFNFPATVQYGNALTVTTAGLTSSKNTSVGNIQLVYGAKTATIGSYILSAGSAEGLTVSKISFSDATPTGASATTTGSHSLGAAFTNLELYYGTTKLGSTIVPNTTDAAGTEYSFYPQGLNLAKGQSIVVNLKGDVLVSPTWSTDETTMLYAAESTGQTTTNSANVGAAGPYCAAGQKLNLTGSGALTGAIDSSRPSSAVLYTGQTDTTIGIWKLSANSVENLTVSKIVMISDGTATSSGLVKNLKLYCGATQFGSAVEALVAPSAGNLYAAFSGECVVPKGSYKLVTLKSDITDYGSSAYGRTGVGYYTNSLDRLEFFLSIPSPITGVAADNLVARGAGDYASTTAASSSAEKMYVYRTSLTAAIACNGGCSGRARSSTDKVGSVTLTGTTLADAQLRSATTVGDEVVTHLTWATSIIPATIYGSSTLLRATTTRYLDGAAAIDWTLTSQFATSGNTTTTWVAFKVGTNTDGTSTPLMLYNNLSFWIYPTGATSTKIFLADGTSTQLTDIVAKATGDATDGHASTTVTLTNAMWNHVDLPLTATGSSYLVATTGSAYVGIQESTGPAISYIIDAIRLYNDSMIVDVSGGGVTTSATGTAMYLKTTGGTTKATGYVALDGKCKLIPDQEISVGSPGVTYDLITNTNTLLVADSLFNAVDTLSLSSDLGTIGTTAGDISWYDQGVDPKKNIPWLGGATPISVSLGY
jgi:hypothetical protein